MESKNEFNNTAFLLMKANLATGSVDGMHNLLSEVSNNLALNWHHFLEGMASPHSARSITLILFSLGGGSSSLPEAIIGQIM